MVMIKGFTPRLYQETIFANAMLKNTLVVLPTGLGKSMVFLMLAAYRMKQYPDSKIIILSPTKPLCEQHVSACRRYLDVEHEDVVLFTGQVKPEKRAELFDRSRVIVSTPQGFENDVINRRVSFENVSLLVVDECHRAVGDYSYVWVAKQYEKTARLPRILGLTASPGTDMETIGEVVKNLHIENIELRTDEDADVRPYLQEVKMDWIKVPLGDEFKDAHKYLKDCFRSKLLEIKKYGYIDDETANRGSKKDILGLQAALHGEITSGNKDFNLLRSVSLAAEAMKVQHALELLETQGVTSLSIYLDGIMADARTTKVKATKNLAADFNFRSAWIKVKSLKEKGVEHPKLHSLNEIIISAVSEDPKAKIIVFNQYRDNAEVVADFLNAIDGVDARLFVGQQKKRGIGMSQKEQIRILDDFRKGEFNVLVSTSVAEEGLDIPKVDGVIFYEPVPSAIRHIQRRGRTGRLEKGEVKILVAEGTRDEGYRWSAHHKEKRMYRTLDSLRKRMGAFVSEARDANGQRMLDDYPAASGSERNMVIVDHREKGSRVIKELIDIGVSVRLESLDSADFLCSERVGVEYKTKEDFINSIIDGRLMAQAKRLKDNFERPIIVIEGQEDIYSIRKMHPNAVQGMVAAITVGFGIPILYTSTYRETASIISIIAKREQEGGMRTFSLHGSSKPMTIAESQEYIVSSLPHVGPLLARQLLKEFGSVSEVFNAEAERLKKVVNLGEKKSRDIRDVIDRKFVCG